MEEARGISGRILGRSSFEEREIWRTAKLRIGVREMGM
jgi:hypothetical protein